MVNTTRVATLYVNPVSGNDAHSGSQLNPYKSLSCALRETTIPTIIHLAPGTYSTATGEEFPIVIPAGVMVVGNEVAKGKGIVISGSGEYQSPSFGVQNVTFLLLNDTQLRGLTVTNPTSKGTGVWIESTSATLSNNTLINCGREGVFVCGIAKPSILDNLLVRNGASGLVIAGNSKGELLRNVVHKNTLGIAISDFAAPMIANNKLLENRIAIAISRDAQPFLRNNFVTKSTQCGLLINGNATADLGSIQDPAGNIFSENEILDIENATKRKIISVGNQLNATQVKGWVECIASKTDVYREISAGTHFSDVAGHWAEPFIQALAMMKLTSGFADSTYKPNTPVSRAQYTALVANTFNPTPKRRLPNFTDVPKDFWAYNSIRIAASGGFVSGFRDGTFRPSLNVLRLQVIVSLVNGLALPPTGNTSILLNYTDSNTIPKSARTAVTTAIQHRIVVNYPDPKQIQPSRQVTRGEVAAMVYQALVAIGRTPLINSPYVVF
jgi:hypothetical protein